ncbi:MAG: DUF3899 domain-containing protein [Bacillota bacterium]|nr:DUF3899 domain-containing protein [Bacillota bacterium]
MTNKLKRKFLILALLQILIFALSFIFNHKISLLSYINISFYIAFFLLISSLLIYTIQTGFFDVMFKSFHLSFSKGEERKKFSEITPLSELVAIDRKPLLFYGLIIGLLMGIGLIFYYL